MAGLFVDIGAGVFVRAEEVVALHEGIPADAVLAVPTWRAPKPKSLVLLRSGQIMPGYLTAQTIRRRVEQALLGDS